MSSSTLSLILAPTVKQTLADAVVERLRTAIICGKLAPDEPLREAVLAQLMGVSRGPIREALGRLEREGLVVTRPNGRTCVARLARRDLEEVFSLRAALERLAIRDACERATAEDLAEMRSVLDVMASYIQRGITEQEAAELDLRFHEILCRASRHGRLLSTWRTLRPQIYVFLLSRNVASPDFRGVAVDGHRDIVDAIEARDEAQAMAVIEKHLTFGYRRVIDSYDRPCDDEGGSAPGADCP